MAIDSSDVLLFLLFPPGADPKLRDHGRKLCAEEWAAYCGRRDCADAIAKFSNTKSFYLKAIEAQRTNMKRLERSNSLPELAKEVSAGPKPQHKRASLRKKIKKKLTGAATNSAGTGGGTSGSGCSSGDKLSVSPGTRSPFAVIARCVSTPVLPGAINSGTGGASDGGGLGAGQLSRPVSTDNIPRVEVTTAPRDESGDCGGGGRTIRGRRRILHGSSAPVRPASPTACPSHSSSSSFSTAKNSIGNGNARSTTDPPMADEDMEVAQTLEFRGSADSKDGSDSGVGKSTLSHTKAFENKQCAVTGASTTIENTTFSIRSANSSSSSSHTDGSVSIV